MKNITIYGSSSMAGHMIRDYFSSMPNYNIKSINESDIFYNDDIIQNFNFLDKINPDYIINCIRCLVEDSELNPLKAINYNSYFPHFLEKVYKNTNTQLIHLSTDCVFSGEKGNYDETSLHDGHSYYARTKSIGEITNNKDLTIRTSYIGPTIDNRKEELFDWFFRQDGEINGFGNVFWSGITTLELAKGIKNLIEKGFTGLYHMVPSEAISKYNLLKLIRKIWKKEDIVIKKYNSKKIDRSLIDNQKLIQISDYQSIFIELYEYMEKNQKLYKHYNLF